MWYYYFAIFLLYSFLGWLTESVVAIIRNKRVINRGILNGPLCMVYGVTAVILTVGFSELQESVIFLFISCFVVSSVVEWSAAKILEKCNHARWWDYSKQKWNFDGYVSLKYSTIWGILGVLGIRFLNPFFRGIYLKIPEMFIHIALIIAGIVFLVDALGSYFFIKGIAIQHPEIEKANQQLTRYSNRLYTWLEKHIGKRIQKAYQVQPVEKEKVDSQVFASGCSFYKIVALFFIGSFLGDIVETIFCRLTMGVWMSRSSVVWGPFSVVWGLAIAFATLFLYNYRNKSDGFLFVVGSVLGGVYEYFCSVFTEIVFGKIFWDYSDIPFNLGGRINLLFCFFWGIAAVLWLKVLYPLCSGLIEKIPIKPGKIVTWILIIFMMANGLVSMCALSRNTERQEGIRASNAYAVWLDTHFDDNRMNQIYPKAKMVR